ncbi:hypothetical protein ES703_116987 [subsurface metagenome]
MQSTNFQIFQHGHLIEHPVSLGYKADAIIYISSGPAIGDILTIINDTAVPYRNKTKNGLQDRGFSRTIGAETFIFPSFSRYIENSLTCSFQ